MSKSFNLTKFSSRFKRETAHDVKPTPPPTTVPPKPQTAASQPPATTSPPVQTPINTHQLPVPPPAPQRRYTTTRHQQPPFRLGELAIPQNLKFSTLLAHSSRHVTVNKADAARFSVVTALQNRRDLDVLAPVIGDYVPYALTCRDIANKLAARAVVLQPSSIWLSALLPPHLSDSSFTGDLRLEACIIVTLHALCMLRAVVETPAQLAMLPEPQLVQQIKSLQIAVGVFAHVSDTLAPAAMAQFVGNPPPELYPDVSRALQYLALCIAQALHVRRGALGGMSAATLAKLSAAAADLARQAISTYDMCVSSHIALTEDIKVAANDMLMLTTGWTFQYAGLSAPAERAGEKVSALRAAIKYLRQAGQSKLVGQVAVLDLENLERALSDAVGENKIVYQHEIPDEDRVPLPPGRSLVAAVLYEAPRIENATVAQS